MSLRSVGLALLCAAALPACATRGFVVPVGPGTPALDMVDVWQEATRACRDASVFTATIHLKGRAGPDHGAIPGVLLGVALTRNDDIWINATKFLVFGGVFTLAGHRDAATLWLTHDNRVVTAPAADIVEALTGLRVTPREFMALMAGCVVADGAPAGGARIGETLVTSIGPARVFLQRAGASWRVVYGTRPDVTVEYTKFSGEWPSKVHVTSPPDAVDPFDLPLDIEDVNVSVTLAPEKFHVNPRTDAMPMSLAELKASGPLGKKD